MLLPFETKVVRRVLPTHAAHSRPSAPEKVAAAVRGLLLLLGSFAVVVVLVLLRVGAAP